MKKGEGMRELKNLLISLGAMSVMLGVALHFAPPQENQTIWEDITDEEVHSYIQKEEQTEDLPVDGNVETVEAGEAGQPAEELPQAAGQVNEFTYDEAQLLMKLAEAEAGNQGEDGMWLVMSVVINRMNSDNPDYHPSGDHSLESTVRKTNAFSCVSDNRINTVKLSEEVHRALARIESGEVAAEIIGFEEKTSNKLEKYFSPAFEYKDHRFYTEKEQS